VTVGGLTITCAAGTHGFNAITNSCDPFDDHFHGTHVAGTIGAVGNNGVGVTGINWFASMMGLKFLSSTGSGSLVDAINAIEFAAMPTTIKASQLQRRNATAARSSLPSVDNRGMVVDSRGIRCQSRQTCCREPSIC
jgi:subtilisin family serine protease